MIVVAIVGILSAIAYPSYTEYVRKGHRAEARAGLAASGTVDGARQQPRPERYPTSFQSDLQAVEVWVVTRLH